MKKYLILLLALTLSGCASNCKEACIFGFGPGNTAFDAIALHADKNDPCQARSELGRPDGYKIPNWCGAGKQRTTIVNAQGRPIAYIK